jgi:hypothetical protein
MLRSTRVAMCSGAVASGTVPTVGTQPITGQQESHDASLRSRAIRRSLQAEAACAPLAFEVSPCVMIAVGEVVLVSGASERYRNVAGHGLMCH